MVRMIFISFGCIFFIKGQYFIKAKQFKNAAENSKDSIDKASLLLSHTKDVIETRFRHSFSEGHSSNTPNYYINTSPTMTYNWEANSGDQWIIPIGAGIGKVFRFGEMPVDMRLSAYHHVEAPDSAPDWFAEFQIKFIFPK